MTHLDPPSPSLIIGWREFLDLPALGIDRIKAKIDTGARSSALHAFHLEKFLHQGEEWIRFEVHPIQRNDRHRIRTAARVLDYRHVTSSGGHRQYRPVILTLVNINGHSWPIELTLTNRDTMGFRMLLGRQAVRDRFLVHPGRSFLLSDQHLKTPEP